MKHVGGLRGGLVAAALLVIGLCATAGYVALRHHPFHAHTNVLAVSGCKPGSVAENDAKDEEAKDEDGDKGAVKCTKLGSVEGPIETFTAAEQRATKQSAPFQTVAPGALANAIAQRAKKPKTGTSWQPVGNPPLYANSPDYAGSDPYNSGPSRLGWGNLSR